jgi:omega-6 fatty acid desaturase (delta-12 desaturase)
LPNFRASLVGATQGARAYARASASNAHRSTASSLPDQDRRRLVALAPFQVPLRWRAAWQLATTGIGYFGLIATMYASIEVSVLLTLALAFPAGGLVVRLFIIQHDCGHGSFFRSRRANTFVGLFCSLITVTPYENWRRQHANHHAVWNNLDRRDSGMDIYSTCLTVREYGALPRCRRWLYRAARHPVISQVLLPPLVFLILYRFAFDTPASWRRERISVYLTDLGILVAATVLVLTFGAERAALVQLPTMVVASITGMWIFSVQHRFEDARWFRSDTWNSIDAALHGSSYLKLPRVLQWFSGNIGFHHIHHLLPRIPNYRLQACHEACPDISGNARVLTFRQAVLAPTFALWDEERGRMMGFPRVAWRSPFPERRTAGAILFGGNGLRVLRSKHLRRGANSRRRVVRSYLGRTTAGSITYGSSLDDQALALCSKLRPLSHHLAIALRS